jgi:hypothetical protein
VVATVSRVEHTLLAASGALAGVREVAGALDPRVQNVSIQEEACPCLTPPGASVAEGTPLPLGYL